MVGSSVMDVVGVGVGVVEGADGEVAALSGMVVRFRGGCTLVVLLVVGMLVARVVLLVVCTLVMVVVAMVVGTLVVVVVARVVVVGGGVQR